MRDVSVIIVNYNTRDLLSGCLDSVYADLGSNTAEVWVVDNASTDGSADLVKRDFPLVRLIANDTNQGFSRANNQAMRQARGEIWVLINPDTIVMPGYFTNLVDAFETCPQAGIIAPKLLNPDRSIQPSWGSFSSPWTEFFFQFFFYKLFPSPFPLGQAIHPRQRASYEAAHPIEWASGACLAVRKAAADKAGLLDESIFMYGEDMEWCWRIYKAGFPIWYWPTASIIHLARQSSRRDYTSWISRYTRGELYFIHKHGSWLDLRLAGLWIMGGSILRLIIWGLVGFIRSSCIGEVRQRQKGYLQAIKMGIMALLGREL